MMLNLEDAIKHCKEVAKKNEERAEVVKEYDAYTELECLECAENHLQLAKWLEELKIIHDVIDDLEDYDEVMVGYLKKKMEGEI